MNDLGDADLHFWLTRSVGRSIGLNFSAALANGSLSAQDYAHLVDTCRGCRHVLDCQRWLGASGGSGCAARAPEFCAIGAKLAALKPH